MWPGTKPTEEGCNITQHEADSYGLYRWLTNKYGTSGDALYSLIAGFLAIFIGGLAAYLLGEPLLFPSLGPTVFVLFETPMSETGSPRSTITGHFVAMTVGLFFLVAFGLYGLPSTNIYGVTFAHVIAAALAVALTSGILVFSQIRHPPAGATALMVSLGLLTTPRELLSIAAGVVLITITGWAINRSFGVPVPVWSARNIGSMPRKQP